MNEIIAQQESSWLRDQLAIVFSDCDNQPCGAVAPGSALLCPAPLLPGPELHPGGDSTLGEGASGPSAPGEYMWGVWQSGDLLPSFLNPGHLMSPACPLGIHVPKHLGQGSPLP